MHIPTVKKQHNFRLTQVISYAHSNIQLLFLNRDLLEAYNTMKLGLWENVRTAHWLIKKVVKAATTQK